MYPSWIPVGIGFSVWFDLIGGGFLRFASFDGVLNPRNQEFTVMESVRVKVYETVKVKHVPSDCTWKFDHFELNFAKTCSDWETKAAQLI